MRKLCEGFPRRSIAVYSMPAFKWHWRLGVSAVQFALDMIPPCSRNGTFFCTSMLNLADVVALRPADIGARRKVLYFHENQLAYPGGSGGTKKEFSSAGWAQAMSCLAADIVLFNSQYNMASFLDCLRSQLAMIPPPARPHRLIERIGAKCSVLYFPLAKPLISDAGAEAVAKADDAPLHIVWAHR